MSSLHRTGSIVARSPGTTPTVHRNLLGSHQNILLTAPEHSGRNDRLRRVRVHLRSGADGAALTITGSRAIRSAETAMTEGCRIVDLARLIHAELRLAGALAIWHYCPSDGYLCKARRHIKLIGRAQQVIKVHYVLSELGYSEDGQVALASRGRVRRYSSVGGSLAARRHTMDQLYLDHDPADDRSPVDGVDIDFDERVRRDSHAAALRDRLLLDDYAISPSDALLDAVQAHESDGRAVCSLLRHLAPAASERPRTINVPYIAQLSSQDFGLYQDLMSGFDAVDRHLAHYRLSQSERDRVRSRMEQIRSAVIAHKKTFRWRMRARFRASPDQRRRASQPGSTESARGGDDQQSQ